MLHVEADPLLSKGAVESRSGPDSGAERRAQQEKKQVPRRLRRWLPLQAAVASDGCLALPQEIAGLACRILKESPGVWCFRKALHTVWGLLARASGIRA